MDELIKYMISKIGYTLIVIIGLALPGNLLVFVWNRELYMELDLFRLIILSFAIPGMLYVCNFFICMFAIVLYNEFKHDTEIIRLEFFFASSVVLTYIEIAYLMMNKILLPEYTIKDFVAKWGIIGVYLVIGMALVDTFLIPIAKRGIEFGKWLRKK